MSYVKNSIHKSALLAALSVVATPAAAEPVFFGPIPYRSAADSPFDLSDLGATFFLEDFEDGELNTPGLHPAIITPILGHLTDPVIQPPHEFTDSVDADDGVIDGSGSDGHSLRSNFQVIGLRDPPIYQLSIAFEFDAISGGFHPNAFGFVWTDGMANSSVIVAITDREGTEFLHHVDGDFGDLHRNGGTADDMFIGFFLPTGISQVKLRSDFVGEVEIPLETFEIDHVQYGLVVPEPSAGALIITLVVAQLLLRRREGHRPISGQF